MEVVRNPFTHLLTSPFIYLFIKPCAHLLEHLLAHIVSKIKGQAAPSPICDYEYVVTRDPHACLSSDPVYQACLRAPGYVYSMFAQMPMSRYVCQCAMSNQYLDSQSCFAPTVLFKSLFNPPQLSFSNLNHIPYYI